MEQLLRFISYKDDLEIIDILQEIINGSHPVIFKTYSIESSLYCYKGDFKPLSKIGWSNYKKLYSLMNNKHVSELTIYNFHRDIKIIHLGEQMNLNSQKTYIDFILDNRNESVGFFNNYTAFNNIIYNLNQLELLNKKLMSLLFNSMKELDDTTNSYNISSDDFLSIVCDIMKLTGLNLMDTIDFEEKDIVNILNLFDNCIDRVHLVNLDGYEFHNHVHLSEISKKILVS